jgi:hypothetical protein
MFTVQAGQTFHIEWDYDLVANPTCAGFVARVINSAGQVQAEAAWAQKRDMRSGNTACVRPGVFSVVVQARDAQGKEGAMSVPVPITVVEKPVIPGPTPPPPNTTLGAPTNVRLSLT